MNNLLQKCKMFKVTKKSHRAFSSEKSPHKNKVMFAKATKKYGNCEVKYVNTLIGYKITIDGQRPTYFCDGLDHQEMRANVLRYVKRVAVLDEDSFQKLSADIEYLRDYKPIIIHDDYYAEIDELKPVLNFVTNGIYLD